MFCDEIPEELLALSRCIVNDVFGPGLQEADREDYAQDVVVHLLEHDNEIGEADNWEAMAYEIGRCRAIDILRRDHIAHRQMERNWSDVHIADMQEGPDAMGARHIEDGSSIVPWELDDPDDPFENAYKRGFWEGFNR